MYEHLTQIRKSAIDKIVQLRGPLTSELYSSTDGRRNW